MNEAAMRMTVDEFLRFEGEQDVHYELHDGLVVAMAPPADAHGVLAVNIGSALMNALRGRGHCRPRAQAGIALRRGSGSVYEADLAVSCAPPDRARRTVEDPILVVEILSRSTREFDRRVKAADYKTIPSIVEILLIDSERMWAEVHRREAGGWSAQLAEGAGARLSLASAGLDLPLADLYEGVALAS
jgi:Uma2 family endonuclease